MNISLMGLKTFEIAADIYADLKIRGMIIEDDDIFIAASAIENNATLITQNVKHFSRITNLKLLAINN